MGIIRGKIESYIEVVTMKTVIGETDWFECNGKWYSNDICEQLIQEEFTEAFEEQDE